MPLDAYICSQLDSCQT